MGLLPPFYLPEVTICLQILMYLISISFTVKPTLVSLKTSNVVYLKYLHRYHGVFKAFLKQYYLLEVVVYN